MQTLICIPMVHIVSQCYHVLIVTCKQLTKMPVAMKAKVTMGLKWAPLAGAAT